MLKIQFLFIFVQTNIFFIQIFRKTFFFQITQKKKMKKRFRHFSHVITKFFIQNANELHKRKKIIRKFFSFHNVQFRCLILLRHFFFDFWNATFFFFSSIFKIKSIFQHFFVFWNSSSRSIFIITLSRNKTLKHLTKKIKSYRDRHLWKRLLKIFACM